MFLANAFETSLPPAFASSPLTLFLRCSSAYGKQIVNELTRSLFSHTTSTYVSFFFIACDLGSSQKMGKDRITSALAAKFYN